MILSPWPTVQFRPIFAFRDIFCFGRWDFNTVSQMKAKNDRQKDKKDRKTRKLKQKRTRKKTQPIFRSANNKFC